MPSASAAPLTLSTAGHIDHGKTVLVEALTGKNTDRLAEERRRGISIELGFARLELPDGRNLSVVDVPGHERFVRTMVSGATGVDLFLLVVAVDDGVMPQTREHLAVLRALGIDHGAVALTKCDLTDQDAGERARQEVRDLLPDAPLVNVSATAKTGLNELRAALAKAADRAEDARRASTTGGWTEPAILHVDRAFTLHGIGTVVTGTLRGGTVRTHDRIQILPRGTQARIRGIHVHDRPLDEVTPGQRAALNLVRVARGEVDRGDVIAALDSGRRPSYRLDIELRLEAFAGNLDGDRVQIHHGTRDAPARVVYLEESGRFAQLRLRSPLIAGPGDRAVIRRIAPPDTLGGGEVIDPVPSRHGPGKAAEKMRLICEGSPDEVLSAALKEGVIPAEPSRWLDSPSLAPALRRHPPSAWEEAAERLRSQGALVVKDGALVSPSPEPAVARPSKGECAMLSDERELATLELLRDDGVAPRSPGALAEALGTERDDAVAVLKRLVSAGAVTRVAPAIYYATADLPMFRDRVIALAAERQGSISLAELRDALGTSRKYAQALLEYFDAEKVTIRRGERHHLRRSVRAESHVYVGRQGSGGPAGLQSQ